MKHFRNIGPLVSVAALVLGSGCAGVARSFIDEPELIEGEGVVIDGHEVKVYAFRQKGLITHLGVIIPYPLIVNPPTSMGETAGAFASLSFPPEVHRDTFFDHIDIRWEPNGHAPDPTRLPMFDVRAFGISKEASKAINGPDSHPPAPQRIPDGMVYQGINATVPNLGVRAVIPSDMDVPFVKAMPFSYWHGELVALEPMIKQARLNKDELAISSPQPEALGRVTRFPTHFRAVYDAERNAYGLVFEDFVETKQ
jgi:hypothetical protein